MVIALAYFLLTGSDCIQFKASIVGSCFCNQALRSQGTLNAITTLYQSGSSLADGSSSSVSDQLDHN